MKKQVIIGLAVLLLVACIGGVMYWQYTRSPQYSLGLMQQAVKDHDWNAFEKYVDLDSVASRLIDSVIAGYTQEKPQNSVEAAGAELGKGLVAMMKPGLIQMVKEEVKKMVETGQADKNEVKKQNPVNLKGLPLFSGSGAKSVKIAYVKKEGKMAVVGFQTQPEGYAEPVVLDLKLRERDGYWQLMEFSNYTAYQKKIDELETKRVAKLNESVIKEMRKSLVFKDGCTKTTRHTSRPSHPHR